MFFGESFALIDLCCQLYRARGPGRVQQYLDSQQPCLWHEVEHNSVRLLQNHVNLGTMRVTKSTLLKYPLTTET